VAAGHEMRVSDAEREAAAAELRDHFASGRLDQEELNDRLDRVFAAKTRGDLNGLFGDLPSSGRGWDRVANTGSGTRDWSQGPTPGSWNAPPQWGPPGGGRTGGPGGPGPFAGRLLFTGVLLWALLVIGVLGAFGIGAPRPFGFVLIIAAFALLRRLLFGIFGRRWGGGRGRGGCRRR
jgi:Domain of unknown function (DUF1707)